MLKTKGFTLLELMIVIAIIGIIAAVAYPSYQEQIRKTKRTAAQADLMELSSFLERRFTENNSYLIPNGSIDPISTVACATAAGCKPSLTNVVNSDDYIYSFPVIPVLIPPTQSTYLLQAVPQDSQASDTCGTMTLAQTGATTAATSGCWR